MPKSAREFGISTVAVIVGMWLVYFVGSSLSAARPALSASIEDEDLAFSAQKLKGFTLGMDGLVADFYWMRSLQYIGDKLIASKEDISIDNLNSLDPRLLYPLLDSATTFDPNFIAAYNYGAVVLPAIDPALAIRIAEKGISNNPTQWRLYQHLGYIYWKLGRYEEAAATYQSGSEIEGAPPFMRLMSARLRENGSSRATAKAMYEEIFRTTDDRNIKDVAELRLVQIASLNERDTVQGVLDAFKLENGRCAQNWREIAQQLSQSRTADGDRIKMDRATLAPVDPTGAPYLLSTADCKIKLDEKTSKVPKD